MIATITCSCLLLIITSALIFSALQRIPQLDRRMRILFGAAFSAFLCIVSAVIYYRSTPDFLWALGG